jgi:general secretion pathway protein G
MTSQKGFTLIELMLVLALLIILAGIAVPRLVGLDQKAEDTAIYSVGASIRSAMEVYHQFKGEYPAEVDDWQELDQLLDIIEFGQMDNYYIDTFEYSTDDQENNYLIKVSSSSSGKEYLIKNDGFSEGD